MQETWKDIIGYEGLYQVSNLGNVKSLYYNREKILKFGIDIDGYCKVVLCKDKIRSTKRVHRLVASAFINNENDYPEVNHKDEDKKNNMVENLEFCTTKYNQNYGTRTERSADSRGRKVLQMLNGVVIEKFKSATEVKRKLGYNQGHVSECCRECKSGYGFEWSYYTE